MRRETVSSGVSAPKLERARSFSYDNSSKVVRRDDSADNRLPGPGEHERGGRKVGIGPPLASSPPGMNPHVDRAYGVGRRGRPHGGVNV